MENEDKKLKHGGEFPDRESDDQWMSELMKDVDGELDQVTSQLRESYLKLFSGLEKLDKEIETAIEEGDEMRYQAAQIKKSLVESRLRELEALNILA